jgi:hypothetical protein
VYYKAGEACCSAAFDALARWRCGVTQLRHFVSAHRRIEPLSREPAMPAARWNATVIDSPGFEPYAVVGDLVVAVRTPRSRNFVTIEVAAREHCGPELTRRPELILAPTPFPQLPGEWRGEIELGSTVELQVGGGSYRLTLARVAESEPGLPWISCEFCVERD